MSPFNTGNNVWNELVGECQGIYKTPSLQVIASPDGSVYLESDYTVALSKDAPISLGLCRDYPTFEDFMKAFLIKSCAELDTLTPAMLLSLYKKGIIWVSASMDQLSYVLDLVFRIKNHTTYITDNDTDEVYSFSKPLLTADQIIAYTKEYAESRPSRLSSMTV